MTDGLVDPDSLVWTEISAGRELFSRNQWADGADRYLGAGQMLAKSGDSWKSWRTLVIEHLTQLHASDQPTLAIAAAEAYIRQAGDGPPQSLQTTKLLLAAGRAQIFDWEGCQVSLDEVDQRILEDEPFLVALERRTRGLLEVFHLGDIEAGRATLTNAAQKFRIIGLPDLAEVVEGDARAAEALGGSAEAIIALTSLGETGTPSARLRVSYALARTGRYEHASLLLSSIDGENLDPNLGFEVLFRQALLLHAMLDQEGLEALIPRLNQLADSTERPEQAKRRLDRILGLEQGSGSKPRSVAEFEAEIYDLQIALGKVRESVKDRQTIRDRLIELRRRLAELDGQIRPVRLQALLALTYGDALLALAEASEEEVDRNECLLTARQQLERALQLAETAKLREIYGQVLRLLGDLELVLGNEHDAASFWSAAYSVDNHIASVLINDTTRVRYLAGSPDVHDRLIDVAHRRFMATLDPGDAAAFVMQLEAARGAAILPALSTESPMRTRSFPLPSETDACWRLIEKWTKTIPSDQAIWFMHLHPEAVFSAVIARGYIDVVRSPIRTQPFIQLLEGLVPTTECEIEKIVAQQGVWFDAKLNLLAQSLGSDRLLAKVPASVSRLAVVAGGLLSTIPFSCLPVNGDAPLIRHYALSKLPCLSLRIPLQERAEQQRGDDVIRVRGKISEDAPSEAFDEPVVHTVGELQADLRSGAAHCRVDGHGVHDRRQPLDSYIQLTPTADHDGRLSAQTLASFDLSTVGLLTLGACETGLSQVEGRNEDFGFVRAALIAGCSSIVAADFKAEDRAAQCILESFQRELSAHRKDKALQRAILAMIDGDVPNSSEIPHREHPLRWACWNLYGDTGLLTGRGPLRRKLAALTN